MSDHQILRMKGKLSILLIMIISSMVYSQTDKSIYKLQPKKSGWFHMVRVNAVSKEIYNQRINMNLDLTEDEEEDLNIIVPLNGLEIINGYFIRESLFLGAGIGYNVEYYKPYIDAKLVNLPVYFHGRLNIPRSKNSMCLNISLGKNFVQNRNHDVRPTIIAGGMHSSWGIGFRRMINEKYAIILDLDYEIKSRYKLYGLGPSPYFTMSFIKLKLSFEFNH